MVTVLVTDPEQRAALATVRSVGRRGWRALTLGTSRGLAGRSRFAAEAHVVAPDALRTAAGYRDAVTAVVRLAAVDVVIPVTDAASRALLGHDADIGARIAGPSPEAYQRASDKAGLLALAGTCGLRVPRQVVLETPADRGHLAEFTAEAAVIKPARSVVEVGGRTLSVGVRFVDGLVQLPDAIAAYPAEAYPLLIQERTFGDGIGVFLLRQVGQTRLSFGHRRLREKPPAGGVSTYREAMAPPLPLLRSCEQLLDALQYEGSAMIEFKRDATSGEFVLMEINARLWGSVQLAVDAGVDFPAALVEMALGRPIPAAPTVRLGKRTCWELGEVDHAIALARRTRDELHGPPDLRVGVGAALRVLFDRRFSDRAEVFRIDDPMPFVAELYRWIWRR